MGKRFTRNFVTAIAAAAALAMGGGIAFSHPTAAHADSSQTASPTASPTATTPAPTRLSPKGGSLIDDQGRTVLLHGVNVVEKNAPYYPVDNAAGFTKADADYLVKSGFNVVRFGVMFEGIMPTQGKIDPAYLNNLNRTVQLLAARGIWTILDFHQDVYASDFGGDGFPEWARTDKGTLNLNNFFRFPIAYQLNPAVMVDFTNFWNNKDGVLDYFIQAQKATAAYFNDSPYILGLELFNEPTSGTDTSCGKVGGCPTFERNVLTPDYNKMIAAIRTVAPTMPVLEEPLLPNQYGIMPTFGSSGDPNVIYSFHDYCSLTNISPAVTSAFSMLMGPTYYDQLCGASDAAVWNTAKVQSSKVAGAQILTEFGATDDLASLKGVTATANANLTSWIYWAYKEFNDPATTGPGVESLFRDDSDLTSLKPGKGNALIQTYPQVTAGTPTKLSYDPDSGKFSYSYTANTSTAPTVIYVANGAYTGGWSIDVSGAKIVSQTDSQVQLENTVAAGGKVTVSITSNKARPVLTPHPASGQYPSTCPFADYAAQFVFSNGLSAMMGVLLPAVGSIAATALNTILGPYVVPCKLISSVLPQFSGLNTQPIVADVDGDAIYDLSSLWAPDFASGYPLVLASAQDEIIPWDNTNPAMNTTAGKETPILPIMPNRFPVTGNQITSITADQGTTYVPGTNIPTKPSSPNLATTGVVNADATITFATPGMYKVTWSAPLSYFSNLLPVVSGLLQPFNSVFSGTYWVNVK